MRASVLVAIQNLVAVRKTLQIIDDCDARVVADLCSKTIDLLETALAGRPIPSLGPSAPHGVVVLTRPPTGGRLTLLPATHPFACGPTSGAPWQLQGTDKPTIYATSMTPAPLLRYARQAHADVQCLFDLRELES